MTQVTIIGLGGIGSHLADRVAQYLATRPGEATLTLVDGKPYVERKRNRQAFRNPGNKAASKQRELAEQFPKLTIHAVTEFLTPENAEFFLLPGSVVLACVDNHATRKLVADIAATLDDVTVVSGGNDLGTYGTVLLHLRRGGADVNPPLTQGHPEIAHPAERAPWEMGCEELAAAGATQVLATNFAVASCMFNVCWDILEDPDGFAAKVATPPGTQDDPGYDEVLLDVRLNRMRPRRRPPPAAIP